MSMDDKFDVNWLLYLAVAISDHHAVKFLLRHNARANVRINADQDPLQRFNSPESPRMNELLESFTLDRRAKDVPTKKLDSDDFEEENEDEGKRGRSFSVSLFGPNGLFGNNKTTKPQTNKSTTKTKFNTWNVRMYREQAKKMNEECHSANISIDAEANKKPANKKRSRSIVGFIIDKVTMKLHKAELMAAEKRRLESVKRVTLRMPTAMHQAAAIGDVEIIRMLVKEGQGEVNVDFEETFAPLDIAVIYDHLAAAEALLDLGANVNAHLRTGKTALYHAIKAGGHEPMLRLLLDRGAKTTTRTNSGVTPLHLAIERRCLKAIEILLNEGCDLNARTEAGITPLHCAAVLGDLEVVEMLVRAGAKSKAIVKAKVVDVSPLCLEKDEDGKRIAEVLEKYADRAGIYKKLIEKMLGLIGGDNAAMIKAVKSVVE